jgi:hypothetical protein
MIVDKNIRVYKMKGGRFLKSVAVWMEGSRIFLKFPFNRPLMAWVKSMAGARYHGYDEDNPRKLWSVKDCPRNHFQFSYLMEERPYDRWRKGEHPTVEETNGRLPLYDYQREMVSFVLHGRWVILACEMGTGKSRVFIEVMERAGFAGHEVFYVGPRAGVRAVGRELIKWESKVEPLMMTYNGLVSMLKSWEPDRPAPKMVCFDECSKIKTPGAQRSQAAQHLADQMREEWGEKAIILGMSGTPAPRAPVDWWNQCEVVAPGFIKEGNRNKAKARLCLTEKRESISGVKYPHLVTWWDDENKCKMCGGFQNEPQHHVGEKHAFVKSKDEVSYLYERLKGLVTVKFKKDCLDLPPKIYEVQQVRPTPEVLRVAKVIRKQYTRAVTALMMLRELSDGFQYNEEVVGQETCPNCEGKGQTEIPIPIDREGPVVPENFRQEIVQCPLCNGEKQINKMGRVTEIVSCPKDDIFIEQLDEHEDIGRFIVWGGFQATIDRLVTIAQKQGWSVLRIDGRGDFAFDAYGSDCPVEEFFDAMDYTHNNYQLLRERYDKICVIGQPGAGGVAHTFTASPSMLYYSNTFNGEDRMQSEDRNHRPGCRGAKIIDLVHLPSDLLLLRNLKDKKRLQNLTMGNLEEVFKNDN